LRSLIHTRNDDSTDYIVSSTALPITLIMLIMSYMAKSQEIA